MAIFLDTGFILAMKNADDKNHLIALELMKRFLKNEFGVIYTSTFVFGELVTLALTRLKNQKLSEDLGKYILESPRIVLMHLNDTDFKSAWEKFLIYTKKGLSFTDCTILVNCEKINCKNLATFDNHFKGLIAMYPTI